MAPVTDEREPNELTGRNEYNQDGQIVPDDDLHADWRDIADN